MRKAYLLPVVVMVLSFSMLALPKPASAQVAIGISVRIGPPVLPVYVQPVCPGPDYIWVPGYWAWGPGGYYWVPGTWVLAPEPGLLWTPGWWGYSAGLYVWHPGYWGRHVGFYGGINYGYGYFGVGYVGGEWRNHHFYYNRAVSNVNINVIRNVYENRRFRRLSSSRVSYNGGAHGVNARPTREQRQWDRERRHGRTALQDRHDMDARNNRALHYSENHGRPPIAATQRPTEFSGRGVVRPRQRTNPSRPPARENRARGNEQRRPREQRPTYAPPRTQPRSGAQPRSEPAPRERRQEARPRQEQPRGNSGGERKRGGEHRGGHDHGNQDGRH